MKTWWPLLLLPAVACAQEPVLPGDVMIERYLAQETVKISSRFLDGATNLQEWQSRRPRLKQEFLEMIGLWPLPEKTPLKATVTGTLERENFVIEKLHYQSVPGLYVTANLYRPRKIEGRLPAVLLLVGHYDRGRNGHKTFMQDHGMWFAENGYVCLVVDTLTRGEIRGEHLGTFREGRWWWQARGYTPAGVECWNGIRGIDYLVSRPEVDPDRIGVTGLSGGGAVTNWVTAADDRVKCSAPASGMTDWEGNVTNRLISAHCDCMFPVNNYGWEFTTIAALTAPRPMLFVNCDDDLGFPMAANERIMARLRRVYAMYGKPANLADLVTHGPPGAHGYVPESRVAIFQWLNLHLKGSAEPVQDAHYEFFPEEQLRVFPEDKDLPTDAINHRIDETFVPDAHPVLPKPGGFETWKKDLFAPLRKKSFRQFPDRIPRSDRALKPGVHTFRQWLEEDGRQTRTTEAGIQVSVQMHLLTEKDRPAGKAPVLIVLNPGEELNGLPEWAADKVSAEEPWCVLAPRGVGPATWTKSPASYVERAHVLLGRTVDEGRVWDVAATARWLDAGLGVKVMGRGQAGVIGAYAALFEPSVSEVTVIEPPVSHRDGPIFLSVLQVLDIPDALGLLAPRPLTLIGAGDVAFDRTAEIYRAAGAANSLQRTTAH